MCRCRVNQHLIVANLYSVSISKILVTEFITVKASQNLNLMLNMSTQWNEQLSRYVISKVIECLEQNIQNKSIAKDHRVQNKLTGCKIFVLKYVNRNIIR